MTSATRTHARARAAAGRRRRKRPSPFAFLAAAIVVLGGLATFLARQSTTDDGLLVTAPVSIDGGALPSYDRDAPFDPGIGMAAPTLRGRTFDGSAVTIGRAGRPYAIVFLAHWCPHCQDEVPDVQAWIDRGDAPAGVDLYSVSTMADRTRGNYPPSAWLEREGWNVPVLVDDADGSAADAFGLAGTPLWVFVGSDGEVVLRLDGAIGTERLEAALALLQ